MPELVRTKMVDGGRVIIPAAMRKAMGVAPGDPLVMELHGGELRIRSPRAALKRLRERIAALPPSPSGLSMSEELIAERRAEAAREDREHEEWLAREKAARKRG